MMHNTDTNSSTRMEVVLLITITLPLVLLFILRNSYGSKSNRRAPGPRGLPLIGNMHQFDKINTHTYLQQLAKKHGPLMSLQLGSLQMLVISSASAAREVFKKHDLCFSNRPISVGIERLSYNNLGFIFAPYDNYWKSMRKFSALHLFNTKRSQSFQPIRDEEIARMVKEIRDGAADDSYIVDFNKAFIDLTSSVIFRITFGKRLDEGEEDCAENENSMSSKFHWLIRETQANFVSSFLEDFFPLMGRLVDNLNGAWTQLLKSFKEIDAFYQQLIDEHIRRASTVSSTEDCSSLLDILLQMKKDSSDFTFDHIKAILMDLIVAGTDTSATAAVWVMTLLIKNPVSMKKVQQELRDFAREKGYLDANDIEKLVYLKAVVKEALRLHPPAPIVHRETIEKCELSGYDIEAKTSVYINLYAIGRDPECWENPDEFLPERFINSKIDFRGQDYELIPFGTGRRHCPGISMGVTMTELVVANLLYSFNWELPLGISREDIDMATLPGVTYHKKNHLCLVPKIID